MADTSLNENRLSILIWQISNVWQSKIRQSLKNSDLSFNEYLILETLYKLKDKSNNISQQDICINSSIDKSVVSLKISKLEQKKLINKIKPFDRRSDRIILTPEADLLIENIIEIIKNEEKKIFDVFGSEIFNFTNSLKLLLGKKIRVRLKPNDK